MAFGQLRRYDVQARFACRSALISLVPLLGAVLLVFRNYQPEFGQIIYGARGFFVPALFGCILLSAAASALGMVLGWASAGQRRNDKPGQSWLGFFLGGAVLTVNTILVLAFWMLGWQEPV